MTTLTPQLHEDLKRRALQNRRDVLRIAERVKAGHVTTAFSQCEMLVALYFGGLLRNLNPKDPKDPRRDRFLLSKGQGGLGLYPILADAGYFPRADLDNYAGRGSLLGTHAEWHTPGCEIISGSLGHGLPIATGICKALRDDGNPARVVVMTGDAELYEGSNWEAMLTAAHLGLDNLIVIVDRNGQGTIGKTDPRDAQLGGDGPRLDLLSEKFTAFDFDVSWCDGHEFTGIFDAWEDATEHGNVGSPRCIISDTVKGKGCSVFEDQRLWHYRAPCGADLESAWVDLGGRV